MHLDREDIIEIIKTYERYRANVERSQVHVIDLKADLVSLCCRRGVDGVDESAKEILERSKIDFGSEYKNVLSSVRLILCNRIGTKNFGDLRIHIVDPVCRDGWVVGEDSVEVMNKARELILRASVD